MAPSNETVEMLNIKMQQRLLACRELLAGGPTVEVGPYTLHEGDEIVTRRNDRSLRTDRGLVVKNRATWMITKIESEGALRAEGPAGRVRLPSAYVADHVELGYASNEMVAQGRTVDDAYLYLDRPTTARGLYVAMTRGRRTNEVFVATNGESTAVDVFTESMQRDRIDRPAIARGPMTVNNGIQHTIERLQDRGRDRSVDRGIELGR